MACECFYKHNNHKNDQSVASGHSVRLVGQVNLSVLSSRLDQQIQFGWHDWQIHLTKQLDWLTLYHWMINFMIVFFMKTPTSHGFCHLFHIVIWLFCYLKMHFLHKTTILRSFCGGHRNVLASFLQYTSLIHICDHISRETDTSDLWRSDILRKKEVISC